MEFIGLVLFVLVLFFANAIWLGFVKRSTLSTRSDRRENFRIAVAMCAALAFMAMLLMLSVNVFIAYAVTFAAVILTAPLYRKFVRKMEGARKPD